MALNWTFVFKLLTAGLYGLVGALYGAILGIPLAFAAAQASKSAQFASIVLVWTPFGLAVLVGAIASLGYLRSVNAR